MLFHSNHRTGRQWIVLAILGIAVTASVPHLCGQAVPFPVDSMIVLPIPGESEKPDTTYDPNEYGFSHSATHLQGHTDFTKYAALVLWNYAQLPGFYHWIVVNNTDTAFTANVSINYYDLNGNFLNTVQFSIPPHGHYIDAGDDVDIYGSGTYQGIGSAQVVSDRRIVGTTILGQIDLIPEMVSLQQLQSRQIGKTLLYTGPILIFDNASLSPLTHFVPYVAVRDVSGSPNPVLINTYDQAGNLLLAWPATIPANGVYDFMAFYISFTNLYGNPAMVNQNYSMEFVSLTDQPLVGEVYQIEETYDRKMFSYMMANTPGKSMIAPEVTEMQNTHTALGITNASSGGSATVQVKYYDTRGNSLGRDVITLPKNGSTILGAGMASSPHFPASPDWLGWSKIVETGVRGELVGWTATFNDHLYRKVWGEVFDGINGLEPGDGYPTFYNGKSVTEKVVSIIRAEWDWYWPGYVEHVNPNNWNLGEYSYDFFDSLGTNMTAPPNIFAGLNRRETAMNPVDAMVINPWFGGFNYNGRLRAQSPPFSALEVIGDPLSEWGLPNYGGF